MRIILLSGKPSSGKTRTLEKLQKILKEEFGAIDITANYNYWDKSFEEFDCVYLYKNKSVAIRIDGDTLEMCIDAIVRYACCDVLVMAYSDKFSNSLEELVEKHASQCYHKVVKKNTPSDSDNDRACNEIIDLL